MRALLVRSRAAQPSALATFLDTEGVSVERVDTGADALDLLRHYPFDVVLLDLLLSDMDGTLLLSRIRAAGHDLPAIALSGSENAQLRIKALSLGADDIVDQKADPAELLARMRAVIRRSRGFSQSVLRAGDLSLDLERQSVTVGDTHVPLTNKEFSLLQLLTLRKNTVMTKEAILTNLYGGMDEPEAKIIDVFVCKVRAKLAKAGLPDIIKTVWGRGYLVSDASRTAPASIPCTEAFA